MFFIPFGKCGGWGSASLPEDWERSHKKKGRDAALKLFKIGFETSCIYIREYQKLSVLLLYHLTTRVRCVHEPEIVVN
jgi:hypothetical protein